MTEAESYFSRFRCGYDCTVSFLDTPKFGKTNIFVDYPCGNHRYPLGLENLIETHLLAACGGLVCGYAWPSELEHVIGQGKFQAIDKVWKDPVTGNKLAAWHWWHLRSILPRVLDGFRA